MAERRWVSLGDKAANGKAAKLQMEAEGSGGEETERWIDEETQWGASGVGVGLGWVVCIVLWLHDTGWGWGVEGRNGGGPRACARWGVLQGNWRTGAGIGRGEMLGDASRATRGRSGVGV